ncbi:MAG: InlB B-repeat-containing protein, partial [Lachnospiraceae bacterium]|nr:InlB B-repeat-containing protein [Lachnospiraceae bacterium]
SLLLDCDSVLEAKRFDAAIQFWKDSEIRTWLNGSDFLYSTDVFTVTERSAVALSNKEKPVSGDSSVRYFLGYAELKNDQVFLLDEVEATRADYGYHHKEGYYWSANYRIKQGASSSWWLRSPKTSAQSIYDYVTIGAAYIDETGETLNEIVSAVDIGVSPAFNVSLPTVIFSSAVTGTAGQPGAEYKLTLKDSDLMIAADKAVIAGENKILIPYTIEDNSDSAEPDRISVVVTDGTWTDKGWSTGAKILQYAQLDTSAFSLSGSGTFALDSSITGKWGKDYHVYVLAEDVNGNYESDYASAPVEIKELIEKAYTVTFDLNGKEGTAPEVQSVPEGGKASEPSGVMVTGYNAEGWYKEAACTNKWDFANDTVTADITLYAKWAPVSYTVKYDPNKPAAALSEVSGTTEDSTHTYDEAKNLSANGYSLEGYSFSSWNTVADGSGTEYAGGASVKNLADTEGATITLYAQWKEYTHSALDPVPEIKDDTTQLWLVKGQKFTLQGWSLDDKDKDKLKAYKKLISINKKGNVKVKNTGTAVIVKKDVSGNVV